MTTQSEQRTVPPVDVSAGVETGRRGRPSGAVALVIAALAALAGFGIGWLVFDDDESTTPELPTVVEQWADAWVDSDADALATVYSEDGRFDGILAVGFEGRDEIRDSIDTYWDMDIVEMEPDYVYADSVGAVVVWNIVTSGEGGDSFQAVTDFEWDWDDPDLLRSTSMNW